MTVILSGASGSGKTSACKLVAEAARASRIPTGGIICPALFQDGRKVGIECADLSAAPSRNPWKLAEIRRDAAGQPPSGPARLPGTPGTPAFDDSDAEVLRYGMWEFSKAALAAADRSIIEYVAGSGGDMIDGIADPSSAVVFVDEIGPLELNRGTGLVKTLAMLDEAAMKRGPGLRFLVVARPDIATRLEERWPDSRLVEMTGSGYPDIAGIILTTLGLTAGGNR